MAEGEPTSHVEEKPKATPKKRAAAKKSAPAESVSQAEAVKKAAPRKRPAAKRANSAATNGVHTKAKTTQTRKAAPRKKQTPPTVETPVARAEDVLDETGRKLGAFLSFAAKRLRRAGAIAKEEIEDLWAEAQSIRRGDTH